MIMELKGSRNWFLAINKNTASGFIAMEYESKHTDYLSSLQHKFVYWTFTHQGLLQELSHHLSLIRPERLPSTQKDVTENMY